MRIAYSANQHEALFPLSARWYLQAVWIFPESLGSDEVDAVLPPVCFTLFRIELESHGIDIIPAGYRLSTNMISLRRGSPYIPQVENRLLRTFEFAAIRIAVAI